LRVSREKILRYPPEVWRVLGEKKVHNRSVQVNTKFFHGSRSSAK
jgi:hypothetical protein